MHVSGQFNDLTVKRRHLKGVHTYSARKSSYVGTDNTRPGKVVHIYIYVGLKGITTSIQHPTGITDTRLQEQAST
jgi:hypothetical protein